MYLTRINEKTGRLFIEDNNDGILAIEEFRDILEDEKLGLNCLTAIALVADYQSPIKYYSDEDRPKKAMEEVTGNRKFWSWPLEIIQRALKKYDELQYDPTLEEGRIYYDQKVKKLKDIQIWDTLSLDNEKRMATSMGSLKKELRSINTDIDDYEKRISGKDVYKDSPVVNNYTLSRLEQKLTKLNSFYHETR